MEYSLIAGQINSYQKHNCFKSADKADLEYLTSLDLPKEVMEFYSEYSPVDTIEINGIRLLPISEIMEENTNYTPGYLLNPLGFCVITSTIEGDVYCVSKNDNGYVMTIASHDEIYEGQSIEEIISRTKQVCKTFIDFLNAFVRQELPSSFYDLNN